MREKATYLPLRAILICFLFSLMIIGCDLMASDDEPFDKIDPMVQPPPPIEMTLELQQYDLRLFQPVSMKLHLRNMSDTTITIGLPGGGRGGIYYNFFVVTTDSLHLWNRLSDDFQALTLQETLYSLDAGESITWQDIWDQKDLNGNLVRRGTYKVYGTVSLSFTDPATGEEVNGDFATKPGTIQID